MIAQSRLTFRAMARMPVRSWACGPTTRHDLDLASDRCVQFYATPRPPRRLAAYGSTNMYRPLNNSRKSGGSGAIATQEGGCPNAMVTKLATTVAVKMIDSQR